MAGSPSPRVGIIAALTGWVAVIVVARGRRTPQTWLGVDNVELVLLGAVAVVMVAGLVILSNLRHLSGWQVPERQSRRAPLIFMLVVLVLLVWRPEILDGFSSIEESLRSAGNPAAGSSTNEQQIERTPVAQTTDIVLLLVLLSAITAAAMWFRKRRDPPTTDVAQPRPQTATTDVLAALTTARRQLQLSDDPRTAVLTAYAALEEAAAGVGAARQPAETPTEHVTRWLTSVPFDHRPVLELGHLYERARFSYLPITDVDKQSALEALATALDQTRASQ